MHKYKKIKKLGSGGQGHVYLVQDEKTEKFFAEKTIICQNSEELNYALLEAQALLKLQHRSIVGCELFYIDQKYEQETTYVCIVCEYCESGSLQKIINIKRNKKEIVPKNDILKWIEQITYGIMYCHQKNCLHRDLKPANIFLRNINKKETEIKIGDFGFAKTLVDSKFTNTTLGTQFYSAPEIRRNLPYNHKIDIWGIGIILLDLLLPETLDFAYEFALNKDDILKEVEKRYDKEMSNFVQFLVQLDQEKRPTTNEILNYIRSMDSTDNYQIEKEEINESSFLKNEKELRDENLQLKLKCEELKRINELKDEEIFILNMELEEKKNEILNSNNTPSKESQGSLFESLFGIKTQNKELISPKEITIDNQREPIKGALFDVIFATWKSKEFGTTLNVVLKTVYYLNKSNPTLEDFKMTVQYDRLKSLNECKGFEITHGIVELYSTYYLVAESLSGGNLRNILLNQNIELNFKQKLKISFQIANTLMYLHTQEKPLVFSALKSNLILLNEKNEAKLTCTYFIKLADSFSSNSSLAWIYKSPEILYPEENLKYGTEDEIYAFSIILWELYFRQPLKYLRNLPPKHYRPSIPENEIKDKRELEFISIIKECWDDNRSSRPTAKNLVYRFGKLMK
eukprot:gene9976-2294_t